MFPIQFSNEKRNLLKLLIEQRKETKHLQVFIVVTDVMKMQLLPHLLSLLAVLSCEARNEIRKKG